MLKGLGYRSPYYSQVLAERPSLDFFEIVSENFAGVGGQPRAYLDQLRSLYPVSMHGVSLSIGSLDPFRPEYLTRLRDLAGWLEPEFVSDHLCWTRHQGKNSHDLLPVPRTEATLAHVISRVQQVQDFLKRPLFLENPSAYVSFVGDGIHEADFLSEVCRRSGAGVLLDLNNILVGEFNLGVDALNYLARLEAQVCYFHIAGHSDDGPVRVDTHSRAPLPRVYELLAIARKKWPNAKLLLEWDEAIPSLDHLVDLVTEAAKTDPAGLPPSSPELNSEQHSAPIGPTLPETYGTFWKLLDSPEGVELPENFFSERHPVAPLDGATVYNSGYFLRIRDVIKSMLPKTFEQLGSDDFNDLIARYLHAHPPMSEDLLHVADHLHTFVEDDSLAALIQREVAFEKTFVAPDSEHFQTWAACEQLPEEGWEDVRFEITEASAVTRDTWVYRKDRQVHLVPLEVKDSDFLSKLHAGMPLFEAGQVYSETELPRGLSLLRSVFDAGLVTRVISKALAIALMFGTAFAGDGIKISVPRPENAIGFCYLSGSVKPTDAYGKASGGRAVRLRFEGTRSVDTCLNAVREHCRIAYLEQKAQIEKLKGYFFLFATPDERIDFTLSAKDCSATTPGPPKIVTH